jgi:hypothetical protein
VASLAHTLQAASRPRSKINTTSSGSYPWGFQLSSCSRLTHTLADEHKALALRSNTKIKVTLCDIVDPTLTVQECEAKIELMQQALKDYEKLLKSLPKDDDEVALPQPLRTLIL